MTHPLSMSWFAPHLKYKNREREKKNSMLLPCLGPFICSTSYSYACLLLRKSYNNDDHKGPPSSFPLANVLPPIGLPFVFGKKSVAMVSTGWAWNCCNSFISQLIKPKLCEVRKTGFVSLHCKFQDDGRGVFMNENMAEIKSTISCLFICGSGAGLRKGPFYLSTWNLSIW